MELPQHIASFLLNKCQRIELDLEGRIRSSDDLLFQASPYKGVHWLELFDDTPPWNSAPFGRSFPEEFTGVKTRIGGYQGYFDFFFIPYEQGTTMLVRDPHAKSLETRKKADINLIGSRDQDEIMPIDLNYLHGVTGGDQQRMIELLDIFMQEVPAAVAQLKSLVIQGDMQGFQHIAHKLQSNYRYLGIQDLLKLAKQLERLAGNQSKVHLLPHLIQHLESKSGSLNRSLSELKNNLST